MRELGLPFRGSEARAAGQVTWHQLRTRYRAVFPDIYLPATTRPSLRQRIIAAWLWSERQATVAGVAAAALHGTKWIDDDVPIELVHSRTRSPAGIVMRRESLPDNEVKLIEGLPVTTPERTAFDIGRSGTVLAAVARVDALANATGLKGEAVAEVAARHRGARGLRHLETVLDLVDSGSQSPKETWLRLTLIEAGFPRPQTQIPVLDADGVPFAFLDVGWDEWMVAVEYDGDHHRFNRFVFTSDIHRLEKVTQRGWQVVRVTAADGRASVVHRVRRAMEARGFDCVLLAPSVQ